MTSTSSLEAILHRDRLLTIVILVTVIVACWMYLLFGAGTGMYPHESAAFLPPTLFDNQAVALSTEPAMGPVSMSFPEWTSAYVLLMLSMWWLMMIAMMLPSAAPMVITHAAFARQALAALKPVELENSGQSINLLVIAFVAGYLVMWGVFSAAAVAAQWMLVNSQLLSTMMMPTSRLMGSGLLIAAGFWQLTPLKNACLRQCRSPVSFLAANWQTGIRGAIRMGAKHGLFCLGCCWLLMALLFFGGVMNLVWIIALAVYVLVEKLIPAGVAFGRITGLFLMVWGIWLGVSSF